MLTEGADRKDWVWVFGYGSLMWKPLVGEFACVERTMATLHGYRRAFNKLSVANWGTPASPCPNFRAISVRLKPPCQSFESWP